MGIAGRIPSEDISLGEVVLSTRILDFSVEARKFQEDTTFNVGGGPIAKSIGAGVANLSAPESELRDSRVVGSKVGCVRSGRSAEHYVMLPRFFVCNSSAQDSADRSRCEECCAKGFVGGKRISNSDYASFGAVAMSLCFLMFLGAPEQLPCGSMSPPSWLKNLKSINNRQGFFNMFTGAAQVALRYRNARLQIPSQSL